MVWMHWRSTMLDIALAVGDSRHGPQNGLTQKADTFLQRLFESTAEVPGFVGKPCSARFSSVGAALARLYL